MRLVLKHLLVVSVALLAGTSMAACSGGNGGGAGSTSTPGPQSGRPPFSAPSTRGPGPPAAFAVKVYFVDQKNMATGQEPIVRPVERKVKPPALAAAALDALFAGPTPAERSQGLTFVASGATGYSHLHITGDVAYVQLEGGCSSGGSTVTIAAEIVPTLRQFASVSHVKIFDPNGTTEEPTGNRDSIPTCLEP